MTLKVKVGKLTLKEARDVNLPQEHAAWFETVRVEPDTYDVYAYLGWAGDGGGMYRIHSLSALCEGVTTACYYGGSARDRERIGRCTIAHIDLPTYGRVHQPSTLLAQATLDDVLVREEWDPARQDDTEWNRDPLRRMWRFNWRKDAVLVVDESAQPSYSATKLAHILSEVK